MRNWMKVPEQEFEVDNLGEQTIECKRYKSEGRLLDTISKNDLYGPSLNLKKFKGAG